MTWMAQQHQEALDAFQTEVGTSSGEVLSADQQKTLDVLQANLDATKKSLEKLSVADSTEASAPGLRPEYYTSGAVLGNCSDFLVAGPTSGTGAYAYASIDPSCAAFYLSAYAVANGVGGSISSSGYRSLSATVSNGTFNCMSQAIAQANGWQHTLTYPFCT
jgi:hypothetical protein